MEIKPRHDKAYKFAHYPANPHSGGMRSAYCVDQQNMAVEIACGSDPKNAAQKIVHRSRPDGHEANS